MIIKYTRKLLLFNKLKTWISKESGLFDVTMSACFLLYALSLKYIKTNRSLNGDDGLAGFRNISGPNSGEIKKKFQKLFQQRGLKLVIKCNLKIVGFLDVTLNLTDSTNKRYHKPNEKICYIHKESSHPSSITKQLPISIEARLSKIFSNEKVFNESVSIYQEALNKSENKHQ